MSAKIEWKTEAINKIFDEKQKALVTAGFQIEGYIKKSMTSRTGGGKFHIPSAPGEPPAVDTGRLSASISTNWSQSGMERGKVGKEARTEDGIGDPGGKQSDKFKVVVGTNVEYGPPLCFGTSKIAPRPFIRPAFDLFRNKITKMLVKL